MLSFLPGVVGNYPLPSWLWSSTILHEAGSLLRRVHDASVPLAHEPIEEVCLNDVAPYNMVFQEGQGGAGFSPHLFRCCSVVSVLTGE